MLENGRKDGNDGKIPALLDGDKVVIESQDISDYLDEKYPENPLYPADPEAKRKDRELIQKIAPVMDVFSKILFSNEGKTPEEWAEEFLPHLQVFEDELAKGEPLLWRRQAWNARNRRGAIWLKLGTKLPYKEHQLTRVDKWQETMTEQAIVAEIATPPETKLVEARLKGITVDNENL
ncbi:hypothetical protein NQ318_022185 [Aromia moschata]|uniref:GST N-terminal domain-containing protein n=1 Tax=Aromia moschata TaxID=1265417 RepID=A0AAV8Z7H5_9CUCU|nr:hypothetical protein NQ318_022185 [Aromia moschata]